MFSSTVLEVMIGMVACYAAVSLMTSSLYEAIASMLDLRSKGLLSGIQNLLNEAAPGKTPQMTLALYNHALIHPRGDGEAKTVGELAKLPSYVDSYHFATTLVELLAGAGGDWAALGKGIDGITDPQLKQLLKGMYARADQSFDHFQAAVASWFDSGMERLAGAYKRNAQLWNFLLALLIATLGNIDSLHLFKSLWMHPAAVAQIASPSQTATFTEAASYLNSLPLGWEQGWPTETKPLLLMFLGWMMTATSVLFGAPFWFDLLQRFVQIRGTGKKPAPPKDGAGK